MLTVISTPGESGFVGTIKEIAIELHRATGRKVSYTDAYSFVAFLRHIGVVKKVGFQKTGRGRRADNWLLPPEFIVRSYKP